MSPAPALRTTTTFDARNSRISLKVPGEGETTYNPAHNYQVDVVYVPTKLDTQTPPRVIAEHRTAHTYDARHRLIAIDQQVCPVTPDTHTCSGTVVVTASNDYLYDDNDNRTQVVESKDGGAPNTRNYCYDALNRLRSMKTTACTISSGDELFTYDDAGNRLTSVGVSFTYNAQGQLSTCSPSCGTVSHDEAGRTLTWSGWTLTYDGAGRLATACKVGGCATGDKVEMRYDGNGRRIELTSRPNGQSAAVTMFRYQGDALVQELTGGGVTREYVTDEQGAIVKACDPNCASPTASYLVTWNAHGDALALWRINSDGTLTLGNSYSYSTWGSPTTSTHNGIPDLNFRFLYAGRWGVQWDNAFGLGLYAMQARHYAPTIGRFLQPDPARADQNAYAYAADNPVTLVDPTGLAADEPYGFGQMNSLEWAYCKLKFGRCLITRNINDWAVTQSERITGKSSAASVRRNALRHCCWQAHLVWTFDYEVARQWGWRHEFFEQHQIDSKVDTINNFVGRRFGAMIKQIWQPLAYAERSIVERCRRALGRGELYGYTPAGKIVRLYD